MYALRNSIGESSVDGGAQAPPEAFGLGGLSNLDFAQLRALRRALQAAIIAFKFHCGAQDYICETQRNGGAVCSGTGRGRIWSEGISG